MSDPLRLYGLKISYFTGKLEAYLRYKEIAYEFVPMTPLVRAKVGRCTGTTQMPAVELPDGRWMTDTTPMIEWFESQHPEPAVIPRDPLQAFASRFVEDYADEWLWRPALHYRWSHRGDALLLSRRIVDEMLAPIPLPGAWKRFAIRQRQLHRYVRGDGITAATRDAVEAIYLRSLDQLAAILADRPFLLGTRPTLADFGFFASMFRHFGLDPTPAAIMLERAPAVFEWIARVWNARASDVSESQMNLDATLEGPSRFRRSEPQASGQTHQARRSEPTASGEIPSSWSPILREIGGAYLPYLSANATAWKARARRFDAEIQGVGYRALPTSRYRVWCLEKLRAHFDALDVSVRESARSLLESHDCWEPLWRADAPDSGYDPAGQAPFVQGIPVFGA